jgi:hypothetical protein
MPTMGAQFNQMPGSLQNAAAKAISPQLGHLTGEGSDDDKSFAKGFNKAMGAEEDPLVQGTSKLVGGGVSALKGLFAEGGQVGNLKENYGRNMKSGGHVHGKAKVKGDSYSNDTVKAMLSPGEIVIPRSIAQGQNAPDKARAFVEAVLAKQHMRKK